MKSSILAIYALTRRIIESLFALAPQAACRFTPTCSQYCYEAVRVHGLRGLFYCLWRVLRCHPWGNGGHDPVPKRHKTT